VAGRPVITYKVKDGQAVIVAPDGWVLTPGGERHIVDRHWVGTLENLETLRAQNSNVVFEEVSEPAE
jgi:hypothetical protein